ncbi:tyrosine-type recombinase/integrase [Francisella philomiragia]|uniref:Tyrosine-type recombinase/integrase n=1 Tax=Francisella philomiragia TaxID=28110 RepID=A0ABS1GAF8_9GAMM|nr:integrase arm-type DNA-binding domain-containing protein [Francisella philomiragia]MBK2258411.1 tyrosine-type recombinase/integrase [Francisella philomiragia]MBK2301791.1 tyrosine-type recombinase/integrase [Francisella philomiragia]
MKLTDTQIKKLKTTGKDYTKPDGNNLYIRVNPGGKKSFLYIYTKDKKRNVITIGKYPDISLAEARDIAFTIRKDINKGIYNRSLQLNNNKKLHVVAEQWFEKITKDGLSQNHLKNTRLRLNKYILPYFKDAHVDEIKPFDVVSMLREIENKGHFRQRDLTKSCLSCIFRYAIASGLCYSNPTRDISDALIKKQSENYKFIHPVEDKTGLTNLVKDIFAIKPLIPARALQLLLLTGLRPEEVAGLEWQEVRENMLIIPPERMKKKRLFKVPLSTQAKKIIDELRDITGGKKYVFYSRQAVKTGHITKETLRNNLVLLGYDGVNKPKQHTHGLRHLISTALHNMSKEHNWRAEAVEMCLAHQEHSKVRFVYDKNDFFEERAEILQTWADYIAELVN